MSEKPRRTRATEARDTIRDLEDLGQPESLSPLEGSFSALGMLIVDATLSADEEALTVLRDDLRRLIAMRDRGELILGAEEYGRLRSLLIGALTGLSRIAPAKPGHRKIETIPGI
jgi:hypothetical protein